MHASYPSYLFNDIWALPTMKYPNCIPIGSTKYRPKSHFVPIVSYEYDVNIFIAITDMTNMPLKSLD